ncbi:MAG: hypothetical protein Q4B31_03975 [Clostridia bacterium]|nr:hypothetical protein [Clostridia bacterium]
MEMFEIHEGSEIEQLQEEYREKLDEAAKVGDTEAQEFYENKLNELNEKEVLPENNRHPDSISFKGSYQGITEEGWKDRAAEWASEHGEDAQYREYMKKAARAKMEK